MEIRGTIEGVVKSMAVFGEQDVQYLFDRSTHPSPSGHCYRVAHRDFRVRVRCFEQLRRRAEIPQYVYGRL